MRRHWRVRRATTIRPTNCPRSALQGAIITVSLVFGIPLLRSSCPEETATLILYAADQLHRRAIKPPQR